MPTRAPRVCGCGRVVASGTRCACQIKRDADRKARHDATRPPARARGYDSKWDRERAAYLAANPTCVRCGAPSTVVNHKVPHRLSQARTPEEMATARRLFWSRANWEAVCAPDHNGPIQSEERRAP